MSRKKLFKSLLKYVNAVNSGQGRPIRDNHTSYTKSVVQDELCYLTCVPE